jgi:hypothetical protein
MLISYRARNGCVPLQPQVRGSEWHPALRRAIAHILFSLAAAVAGLVAFASSASAAGNGYGWSGGGTPFPGGGAGSVLCAKEISHAGGTLTAHAGHGTLVVEVGPASNGPTVQYIVVQAPSSHGQPGQRGSFLEFSVLAEVQGNPFRTAAPVRISYSGSGITSGAHILVDQSGQLSTQPGSVAGKTLTFSTPPNRLIAVVGK